VAFGDRLEIHGKKDRIGWPSVIVHNVGLCTDAESLANARLIAAAPEMLAALESLAIGLSPASVDMQRETLADLCRVCREVAENALAKVKGGEA
jgi:hypothetical protein